MKKHYILALYWERRDAEISCSRHGAVAAWLLSERAGSLRPVSKNFLRCDENFPGFRNCGLCEVCGQRVVVHAGCFPPTCLPFAPRSILPPAASNANTTAAYSGFRTKH